MRDPRDLVASLKYSPWSTSNVLTNALVWRAGVRQMKKYKSIGIVCQYEDLVNNPHWETNKIFSYLGVKKGMDDLTAKVNQSEEKLSTWTKEHLTKVNSPINNGSIGKFKVRLSTNDFEREIVEYICNKEMKEFGYVDFSQRSKGLKFFILLGLRYLELITQKLF